MYVFTIFISNAWSNIYNLKTLKITKKDIISSIQVLLINIIVAIPGYYLFQNGSIRFITEKHFVLDFLLLYFIFDFVMYLLHFIAHYVWPFKKFHLKHHTHHYFNAISLYVMEPVESLLFGLLLTLSVLVYSFNFYSFLCFITFNWLFGVVAHLNTKSIKQPKFFGNHIFHKIHHEHSNSNYGFYTVIWDKIFRTFFTKK